MKRALILASVASMIEQFNMSNIGLLQEMGYEVHVAANFKYGNTISQKQIQRFEERLERLKIPFYHIGFSRNIMNVTANLKAYQRTKEIMRGNNYDFVHCHSPIGGVCGRIAAHITEIPVIYTAHGFHFYGGVSLKNWLLYYPIERLLAKYTDVLIVINKEDYARAKTSFRAKKVVYVPGVGVDVSKFRRVDVNKPSKRKDIGVPEEAFMLLSVGELNKNKNHEVVIKAMAELDDPDVYYVICGQGLLSDYLEVLINELDLEKQVKLLGFRDDVREIYQVADVFVFPSYREGLSVALMEAMATGLPVVCSRIRGNIDLIKGDKGGYLVEPNDVDGFAEKIGELRSYRCIGKCMGSYNQEKAMEYDISKVMVEMHKVYSYIDAHGKV